MFKQKSLCTAVLAGLGAMGAAGTAQAVHVNPDGLGQVLIYPYYTARTVGGSRLESLISVVNTTTAYKLVKVRFMEGKASREVLDFNLFLSPNDIWTGAITSSGATAANPNAAELPGARIVTIDNSCVTPSDLFTRAPTVLEAFKNAQYSVAPFDAAGTSLDRTREGYVEIIEMGTVTSTAAVQGYIKHVNGIPGNCQALDTMDADSGNPAANIFSNALGAFLGFPNGGLAGRMSIVNANSGINYTYDAVALDQWSPAATQYFPAGSLSPDLGAVNASTTSNVFINGGVLQAVWGQTIDAVSASIMRDGVSNEYILDSGTSQTDWVVTFPTKRAYISAANVVSAPFANNMGANGACDPYTVSAYDREEKQFQVSGPLINPSPFQTPGTTVYNLCWEANVLPFQTSSLLGSTNTANIGALSDPTSLMFFLNNAKTTTGTRTSFPSGTQQGANGWLFMAFQNRARQKLTPNTFSLNGSAPAAAGGPSVLAPAGTFNVGAHYGLPVVGMAVHSYSRAGVISNYAGVIQHKFTRLIPTS